MKKKMLYMSHVDWRWIKQRPHFLAEGLMEFFDVFVLYSFQNKNRKNLQKRDFSRQNVFPFFYIPMSGRIKIVGALNRLFERLQFALKDMRIKSQYVYATTPRHIERVPRKYQGTILYDCMDDHVAMTLKSLKVQMQEDERQLIERSAAVFVSSMNLKQVLINRYGEHISDKLHLVRNGYGGSILPPAAMPPRRETFTLCYVGTVGAWFNFDFIVRSLEDIPQLRYKIIGPVEVKAPRSERIEYTGTVEHHLLYNEVKDTDALMMPFVVNDIVASVDPVKLYEYINYNKNILCVEYPEIARFEPFVFFYDNYESFIARIREMVDSTEVKYSEEDRERFLKENNWETRVRAITKIIEGLEK